MRLEPTVVHPNPSFAAFYTSTYGPMVNLAVSLVDRAELAEEVVQDAYVGLFGRYERIENPAGYLRVAVLNNCRNVLRRRRLMRRHAVDVVDAVDDTYDHLFDVIASLPIRHREVVVLRYQREATPFEAS